MNIKYYDETNINEIKMRDIIFHGTELKYDEILYIDWKLLYGCNYKCSYCFGQTKLNKNDFINIDKLKFAVDNILKIDKKHYVFNILGGEPTYHPHLLELIKYIYSIKNKKISINLISNASKEIEYFEKLLSYSTSENSFSMTYSVHFEYANIEHVENIIKIFDKYKSNLKISLMLHPDYKDEIELYFYRLLELNKKYSFKIYLSELREPPHFDKIDSRYDDNFIHRINNLRELIPYKINNFLPQFCSVDIFYKKNNDIKMYIPSDIAIRNNLKQFKNFYCCGGINVLRIGYNGDYSGGICGSYKSIGNIYEDEYINMYKLTEFVKCNDYQCGCAVNDLSNKYLNIYKAQEYILNYRKKYPELMVEYLYNKINKLELALDDDNNQLKKLIDTLAWWIPVKEWRENFRNKFKSRAEQSRAEQSRAEQSRAEQSRDSM